MVTASIRIFGVGKHFWKIRISLPESSVSIYRRKTRGARQHTLAIANRLLTRNGVQNSEPKSPLAISSRKTFWSIRCENGWSHVKYKDTKCDTRWLSSVTVVHGFAGTWNKGISQSISNVTRVWESVNEPLGCCRTMSPGPLRLVIPPR